MRRLYRSDSLWTDRKGIGIKLRWEELNWNVCGRGGGSSSDCSW